MKFKFCLKHGILGFLPVMMLFSFVSPAHAQFGNISTTRERTLGRQAALEVEKRYPVLRDRVVQARVNSIGQRLARKSGRNIPYTFKVLNLPEVNAFALPGGFIYINRGAVRLARNDSELGGVLAHEIAHVVRRHGIQQAQSAQRWGLGLGLVGMLLGGNGAGPAVANAAAQMVGQGVFLKHSRDAERQADRDAVSILRRTGLDPRGMLTFLQRMERLQKSNPSAAATFFSTHPSLQERERNIGSLVGENPRFASPLRARR